MIAKISELVEIQKQISRLIKMVHLPEVTMRAEERLVYLPVKGYS